MHVGNRAIGISVTISTSLKSFVARHFFLCHAEERPKESRVMVGTAKRTVQRTLRNAKKPGAVWQGVMLEMCAASSFVKESGCVFAPRQAEQRRAARISS